MSISQHTQMRSELNVDHPSGFQGLAHRKLVVVSNREPYSVTLERKTLRINRTPGGLVTALDPVLRESQGLWICWEGNAGQGKVRLQDLGNLAELYGLSLPYQMRGVPLTEKEVNHYYNGYANQQLWPCFHYFPNQCDFNHTDWRHYYSANQKFAQAVLAESDTDDLIWVQDYHLLLVPGMLRESDPQRNIGFFCHIPFPSPEVFRILPQRKELLRGMLGSDLLGFHTPGYAENFLRCVVELLPHEARVQYKDGLIHYENRVIRVGNFPIGVDYQYMQNLVSQEETRTRARRLRNSFVEQFVGVGVDRLDYTKGILERLEAISLFFERYPEYRKRMVFIQIAVPSRTKIPEYQQMKAQIEQAVGRINGRFSEGSWSPIQYLYRGFPLSHLVPYYMIADFALVTPLRDGMNLVAKEYCAAKADLGGALILSELAGAADQLEYAFMVNPYNMEEVATTLRRALETPANVKSHYMRSLREGVSREDIHLWLSQYLDALLHAAEHRAKAQVL